MNRTMKQMTFAGLAFCVGSISGLAGESVVYQFDDWKVTITPRKSTETPSKNVQSAKAPLQPAKVDASSRETRQNGVLIRPVSFSQDTSAVEPTLALERAPVAVVPQLQPTPEPTIPATPTPTPMPPSPTGAVQPAAPCVNCQLPVITPRPSDEIPKPTVVIPQTALYRDIYFSIPFNRVEYNAYPSYRHDATMELLFNQMRPTVIQRGTNYTNPYNLNYGPFYGYGYGSAYGYWDPPYYPFSFGLRIHQSR